MQIRKTPVQISPLPQTHQELSGTSLSLTIIFIYLTRWLQSLLLDFSLPECPPVSTAVPKSSTYSEKEAWSKHMEPIQPPALTNTHCKSSSGRICPGCFLRNSTMILEKANSWSKPER